MYVILDDIYCEYIHSFDSFLIILGLNVLFSDTEDQDQLLYFHTVVTSYLEPDFIEN